MTTIAYDGRVIAADRQLTFDDIRIGCVHKLALFDPVVSFPVQGIELSQLAVYAACGYRSDGGAVFHWLQSEKEADVPAVTDEDFMAIVVCRSGDAYAFDNRLYPMLRSTPLAIGSGWKIALGAMLAGADAIKAVRMASLVDTGTGSGVNWCLPMSDDPKIHSHP